MNLDSIYHFALIKPRTFGGLWYAIFAAFAYLLGTSFAQLQSESYTLSNYMIGALWCGLFAFIWSQFSTKTAVLCENDPYFFHSIIAGITVPMLTFLSVYFLYPVIAGLSTGVLTGSQMNIITELLTVTIISMLSASILLVPFGLVASISLRFFSCRNPHREQQSS